MVEDDETNPEAAVRAAHKLVNVDKVPVIMGTWASAVTTAVAPVCWESKTFLTTVSGADSITHLPHQGYLIRTQPNNQLQATKHAEFIIRHGSKRVFILAIQAPFAEPTRKYLTDTLTPKGVSVVGSLIYDKDKTSYRSEVDQALKAKPDLLYLNGYAPDVAVVLRDLYRAGYDGDRFCQSYALTAKSLEELPKEVTQGVYHRAAVGRCGFAGLRRGGEASRYRHAGFLRGAGDRLDQHRGADHRQGGRGDRHGDPRQACARSPTAMATKVYTAVDGLAALKQGKEIKYSGASGPCTFTDIGDISDCKFRYNQVENGAFKFLEVA